MDMEDNERKEGSFKHFNLMDGLDRTSEFLNRTVGNSGTLSWGFYLLVGFGIYALVNIVVLVVNLFN